MSGGYLDYSGRADRLSGGARRIPVDTPSGRFSVWTKRVGNNPDLKVGTAHAALLRAPHAADASRRLAGSGRARLRAHQPKIYVTMQGPSELGMSADAKLATWDRVASLPTIEVPTLVIGARYDTMDPAHMEMMAGLLPHGSYLYCPNGSHLAMYDDQETYFAGLTDFLTSLPAAAA